MDEILKSGGFYHTECAKQIHEILVGFSSHNSWAFRFFETWGHQGFFASRHRRNQGTFYDCLDFKQNEIQGKYCKANFKALPATNSSNEFVKIAHDALLSGWGQVESALCVPEVCSESQITDYGNKLLAPADFSMRYVRCYEKPEMKSFDWIVLAFFLSWIILIALCTFYENQMRKFSKEPRPLFITFSLISNFEALMRIDLSDSVINCIDGMKALAAMWIIVGHRRGINFPHRHERFTWWDFPIFKVIESFKYNIDTFFACSAVLVTQSLLKSFERRNFNVVKIYINRYLRYFPVLGFLVVFSMSSMTLFMVAGPSFDQTNYNQYACSIWWYKAVIFTQDFGDPLQTCLEHSWYLSADYQIFLVTPPVVFLLWRFQWRFARILMLVVLGLQLFTYYSIAYLKLPDFPDIYMLPQYHAGEYFVGILAGFLMYGLKNQRVKLGKLKTSAGWFFSLGFISFQTFTFGKFFDKSPLEAAYNPVWREIWVASICWIIFACHHLKSGAFIRSFLSHHFLQPLSRMCLCTYLVHYIYLKLITANQQRDPDFYSWWFLHVSIGDVVVSTLLGGILYIGVEAPAGKLTNLFWRKIDGVTETRFSGKMKLMEEI